MNTKHEIARQLAVEKTPQRFFETGRYIAIGSDSEIDPNDKFTPDSSIVPELTGFGKAMFENPFARVLSKVFSSKVMVNQVMSLHDLIELRIKLNRKKVKHPEKIVVFDREGKIYEKLNT